MDHEISPIPSEDEAAAIAAALVLAWPRPATPAAEPPSSTRWRFSGRWWARPDWRPPTWRR